METGIIVYSHTGNTLSVAEKLQTALSQNGHKSTIEQITVQEGYDPNKDFSKFTFDYIPGPAKYDSIIFASPVMAFSLCPVMKRYLKQIPDLQEKLVALLVTQHLKFSWMGGNRAIRQMKRLIKTKNPSIKGSAIVHWSAENRDEQITGVVESLIQLF